MATLAMPLATFGPMPRPPACRAVENTLLHLVAVGDNAAMCEPPNALPPKRKRRWVQFSLRTLLIGVTLLAVFVGPITWLVEDRQRLIRERDEARRAAEWNYRAAVEEQSKKMTAKNAAQEGDDRVRSLELQNAIANERPGINNLIERRDMTKIPTN